jgi:hypothetical protein
MVSTACYGYSFPVRYVLSEVNAEVEGSLTQSQGNTEYPEFPGRHRDLSVNFAATIPMFNVLHTPDAMVKSFVNCLFDV